MERERFETENTSITRRFVPVDPSAQMDCIDGRQRADSDKIHPQGLGGVLGIAFAYYILHPQGKGSFDDSLETTSKILAQSGYTPGAHRGSVHEDAEKALFSGCGFADKMPQIVATLISKKDEIRESLMGYCAQVPELNKLFESGSWDTVMRLLAEKSIQLGTPGEPFIRMIEETAGINALNVTGEHEESLAVLNLDRYTTLDVQGLNQDQQQVFNLDLWHVADQADVLGINTDEVNALTLGLYAATAAVLRPVPLSIKKNGQLS